MATSDDPTATDIARHCEAEFAEVYQVPISTWNEFLAACAEIAKGEHGLRTVGQKGAEE